MLVAITRPVSASLGRCELTFLARVPIDVALARRQHAAYEAALERLGATLLRLPAADDLPDAVFVEDTAIVLDELAIVPIMGAESRRPETASVEPVLRCYRPVHRLAPPATLDGGDVMLAERRLYVGRTTRSNGAAIDQLRSMLAPNGYEIVPVVPTGCLHLKSACTYLGRRTVLVNPEWIDPSCFADLEVLAVAPTEPFAANAVEVDGVLLFPADFPETLAKLRAAGFEVVTVDTSELRKAESAMTCMSLLLLVPSLRGEDLPRLPSGPEHPIPLRR